MDAVSRELRLALAMRGGVSLAVWIGGACAEIDALRRAAPGRPDDSFHGRLAELAGFTRVTVDVIAGASAGGLNATLAAAAIAYGGDLEGVRDVWLDTADLDRLAHPAGDDPVDAPLRGDGYLLPRLREALARVGAGPWQAPAALDVSLAATLLDGEQVPAVQGDDVSFETRHSGLFTFHAGPEPWLSAFERGDPGERSIIDKLAVAGRATSSFPGAFEPATVWAVRPTTFVTAGAGPTRVPPAPGDEVSLWRTFSHSSPPDRPAAAAVLDGGVLDNIPVARAIRAIGSARADAPTSRVLLFLHPSPRATATPQPDAGTRPPAPGDGPASPPPVPSPSVVDVGAGALSALTSQETVLDDIAVLQAFNDRVSAHAAARSALLATLGAPDDDTVVARVLDGARSATSGGTWHRWQAQHACDHLARLLDDPCAASGADVFPHPRMRYPLDTADPPLPARIRAAVAGALSRTVRERIPATGDEVARVRRLASILRSTVLDLEDHVGAAEAHAVLGRVKQALYLVSLTVDTITETAELAWPALAVTRQDLLRRDVEAWVGTAYDDHHALLRTHEPARVAALEAALDAVVERGVDDHHTVDLVDQLRADLLRRLDDLRGGTARLAPTDDLFSTLTTIVERCAGGIAAAAAGIAPGACAHATVAQLLRADWPGLDERLEALDVVLTPLAAWGPANDRPISFTRISALSPTSVADWFARLDDGTGAIPLSGKLAGRQLGNFSGFLRPEYRANDWMWGRVDAAHGLIGVLVDPDRMAGRVRATSVAATLALARSAVTAPVTDAGAAGALDAEALAALWERHEPAVRDEIEALASGPTPGSLPALTGVLRERRQVELLACELPVVDALRRGGEPRPAGTLDELRRIASDHEIVPAGGIGLRPLDEIRPAVDRMRALAGRALRRDHRRAVRTALPWLDAAARLLTRYPVRRLAGAALACAVLAVAAATTSLLPVPNAVPVVLWAAVAGVPAAIVVSARRRLAGDRSLADAFTRLPPPEGRAERAERADAPPQRAPDPGVPGGGPTTPPADPGDGPATPG